VIALWKAEDNSTPRFEIELLRQVFLLPIIRLLRIFCGEKPHHHDHNRSGGPAMPRGFVARELSILAYANGFTLWHYRTNDKPEQVLSSECGNPDYTGYFAPACDLLRRGDQVIVSFGGGPEPDLMTLIVTEAVPCGYVTVRPLGARSEPGPRATLPPAAVADDNAPPAVAAE
jgi:hypothetical protein